MEVCIEAKVIGIEKNTITLKWLHILLCDDLEGRTTRIDVTMDASLVKKEKKKRIYIIDKNKYYTYLKRPEEIHCILETTISSV